MHPTSIFQLDCETQSFAFIDAFPFAVLAVNGEMGPVSALLPLVIDRERQCLLGHVARANPFWGAASKSRNAIAIFKSADAYVSPSFYASKTENARVVPTWNYEALEIRGEIEFEANPENVRPFLAALTAHMETSRPNSWKISDAPDAYIDKLSRAITGFRLSIDNINHVRKLSQNKSNADQLGVIRAFEQSGIASEKILAKAMRE